MTVPRDDLRALVEDWRRLLLPEWRVVLLDEPSGDHESESFWGESQSDDDYRRISIHLSDRSLERSREHVEVTVVHELLHALTRPGRRIIDRLYSHCSPSVISELQAYQTHEEEQLVDRLARALVAIRRDAPHVAPGTVQGPVN